MKEEEEDYDSLRADSDGEMDEEAMSREADEGEQWDMIKDVYIGYQEIVDSDDKDRFSEYVRGNGYFGCKGYFRPSLFCDICESSAVNIAKALLRGESGWKVSLNSSFGDGTYPLHRAAPFYSYAFLDLLITHGARTDIRTKGSDGVDGLFPLNVAVEGAWLHRCLKCWTNKDSAFKLILLLSLPEMKMFLDCISLLAQHTSQTFDELLNYVEQGKLLQMAVLFMAASKQIMATTRQDKDGKSTSAMEVILRQIDDAIIFLITEAEEIPNKPKNGLSVRRCKVKLKTMASARLICELIGKIGGSLEELRQTLHSKVDCEDVVEYVTSLFAREGFLLKGKDIDLSNSTGVTIQVIDGLKHQMSQRGLHRNILRSPTVMICSRKNLRSSTLIIRVYEAFILLGLENSQIFQPSEFCRTGTSTGLAWVMMLLVKNGKTRGLDELCDLYLKLNPE